MGMNKIKEERIKGGKRAAFSDPRPPAFQEHSPSAKNRILVMDDDPEIRNVLTDMLRSLGHSVYAAQTSDEAVACYQSGRSCGFPFSAVLLDLIMTNGLGGPETLRRIAAIDRDVRAIIMSGNAGHNAIMHFSRYGFRRALAKPFTLDELENVLSVLHENGRSLRR